MGRKPHYFSYLRQELYEYNYGRMPNGNFPPNVKTRVASRQKGVVVDLVHIEKGLGSVIVAQKYK